MPTLRNFATNAISSPLVQTTVLSVATVSGFMLTGNGEIVLNALGSVSPFVGSLANNVYAQAASLFVGSNLTFGAIKSTLWGANQILKANKLEKEKAQLQGLYDKALVKLEAEANKDKKIQAVLKKEKSLVEREKALKESEEALLKNQSAHTGQISALEKSKKEVKEAQDLLEIATEALKNDKETFQTKTHEAAKNLSAREEALNARESELDERELSLNQWKEELEQEASNSSSNSSSDSHNSANDSEMEISDEPSSSEKVPVVAKERQEHFLGDFTVNGPSWLAGFNTMKMQAKEKSGKHPLLTNEELSPRHSSEERSSPRRSPSPTRHTTH